VWHEQRWRAHALKNIEAESKAPGRRVDGACTGGTWRQDETHGNRKDKKELVAQVVCGRRVSVKAAVNQESAARANATWIT
jgi:hypothetical protein